MAKPTVTVIEFDGPDYERIGHSYTVACQRCGEQGSFDRYQDAHEKARQHLGAHVATEEPNGSTAM